MSNLFRLNVQDLLRGVIVAVLTAVLSAVVEILKNKGLVLDTADLQQILAIAGTTLVAYLSKNLLTDSDGKFAGKIKIQK